MPIYRYNNKTYDVPESDMWKFEKHTPDAKLDLYDEEGNEYSVPVSDIEKFKRNVKDWRYDKPSVKVETPIKTDSVVESPVFEEEEETAPLPESSRPLVTAPQEEKQDYSSFEHTTSVLPDANADVYARGMDLTPMEYASAEEAKGADKESHQKRLFNEIAELEKEINEGNHPSSTRWRLRGELHKKKKSLESLYEEEQSQLRKDLAESLGDLKGEFEEMYNEESEKSKARLNYPKHNAPANPRALSSYVDLGEIKTFAPASRAKYNMDRITDVIAEYNRVKSGGNWLVGAAKGLQTANFRQWDYGVVSGPEEMALAEAMRKYDAGEQLTKAEEVLLDTEAMRIAVEQAYKVDWNESGFGAGQITAESLPFMAQMMANPASGLGKGLTKGSIGLLTRYAARHLTRNAPKYITKKAVKTATVGTRLAGDVAGATIMTGTTGAPGVLTDAQRRAHGDVQYGEDYRYGGHTKGDSYADALRKSALATTIDNFTEMFPLVGGVTKQVGKGLDYISPKWVSDAVKRTTSSDWAKGVDRFMEKTQWHGPIEEYFEEVEAGLLNMALVGDEKWDEFWTVDKQMETFLGVALMSGTFSTMKTLGYRSEATVARKDADKLNTRMHNALGADWDALEQDLRIPDRASQVLADMRVQGYNTNVMEAALQYAQLRAKQEGAELAEMKLAETNPTVAQAHTAYDSGESATEIDQKAQVETDFESADAAMREIFGENDMALLEGEDFIEVANQFIEHGADAEVVGNYINARSAHEGMLDRLQTEIDALTEGVDAEVDAVTNRETGNVQGVKMKDGSYAHVVTGQVALREDGSVDTQNSSNSIVIMRDGKLEFSSPSMVEEASAPVNAEEHKQQKKNDIEAAHLEQTEQGINEVKRQREAEETIETHGTALIRANENGGLIEVEVSPSTEPGMVMVRGAEQLFGTKVAQIPMEQYQQLYAGRPQTMVDEGRDSVAPNATETATTDATETATPQAEASAPTAGVPSQTSVRQASTTQNESNELQNESNETQNESNETSGSALSRMPMTEQGEVDYANAEPSLAAQAFLEEVEGDTETAINLARETAEEKRKEVEALAQTAPQTAGLAPSEKARVVREHKAKIARAEAEATQWENIASNIEQGAQMVDQATNQVAQTAPAQGSSVATPSAQTAQTQEGQSQSNQEQTEQELSAEEQAKKLAEYREWVAQVSEVAARMAERWGRLLNVNVRVHTDASTIVNREAAERINRGDVVDGWYEPSTNEVHVYVPGVVMRGMMDDVTPIDRLAMTIRHEVVAHKGLREILGKDAYQETMLHVWNGMNESERKEWLAYVNGDANNASDQIAAADEMCAHIAELVEPSTREKTLFERLVQAVVDFFKKGEMPTMAEEIRDLLRANYAYMRKATEANKQAVLEQAEKLKQSADQRAVENEKAKKASKVEESSAVRLSDEVDENGKLFVLNSKGDLEFGIIEPESGLPSAPILLSEGMITNAETNDGYGLVHIEARHGDQIRNAGYASVVEFVEDVAQHYEVIREGKDRNGHQTYMLQLTDKHNNTLMVELSGDGTYWNINTAGIFKTSYGRNRKEVYNRHTTVKQSAETAEVSQGAEQSGTTTPPSMNTPTSSDSKGTDKSSEEQKSGEENVVAEATEALRSQGANVDEKRGDVRFSAAYTPKGKAKEKFIADVMAVTGRSRADVESYLKAEESLTAFIYNEQNAPFLDYRADDRYTAIKENSDYPQGTVDFNNICRKRASFTTIYDRLQREFPMHVFTGNDLAKIREVMKKNGMEVACGLCYVEDRRQLMGEIAESFIEELKGGFKDYASKSPSKAKVAEKIKNQIGEDTYIPDIADLITLAGSTELHKSHPNIYEAFNIFNNARGQQSANLFQGYAEYKREILKWSDAKVKKANDNGGLRIFSYSDFEAHHLIDIVQIINDCAARGVKIQGYTKVPAVAKVLANTNVKLNRSLIPLGDTGIKDGKLAYDPIEGIDINDKDFFDSNDNIGNVLVGCNDEQIRMAMADDFVHYIIPFHTNQKQELVEAKGCGKWTNYKYEQREYKDGKAAEKGVNIYTDVLNAAEKEGNPITNEREFTERFLNVCKERGLTPRFARFLNTDANGEYTYTPGYYKLLLDFKMFDANGNILPQNPIEANFDNQLNQEILADYVKGENAKLEEGHDAKMDKVFAEVKSALGLTPMFSAKERANMSPAEMLERMSEGQGDDIRFSFIGEKGAEALDRAEEATTRLDNLAVAREMETQGKDALAIKMATGWERGADNKWRYETEDVKLKKDFWKKKDVTLGDVADLGELGKAYPDLKDIKVVFDTNESERRGTYSHKNNSITLYIMDANNTRKMAGAISRNIPFTKFIADYMTSSAKESVDKTLVHEIQHAIQSREGFAKGGNKRMRIGESEERLGYEGYRKLAGEVEARNVSERMGKSMEERRASLRTETQDVADEDQIFIYDALESASSEENVDAVNARFNEELDGYINGRSKANMIFHVGNPMGVMQHFLPNLPIVMRPRVINKATNTKHDVSVEALHDLPKHISAPIFVFQRDDNALGVLTEIKDNNGKNVCVAIELNKTIQDGGTYLEVNDIRSIHGRDIENLILPIIHNNTLKYVDKEKGLDWLSSASSNYQQEITKQDLVSATKVVENFENPQILGQENDGDTLYSYKPFGGNRGYVGYSMSKRAAQAREEGRFPKTDFKKEYGVTEKVLDALVKAGIVDNAEWHHTSMYGNKTPFYGWVDDAYADVYAENKKTVKQILEGKNADGTPFAELPTENLYTEMRVPLPEGWYPFLNNLDDNLTEAEREVALMERFGDAYAKLKEASENNRLYHEYEANKGRMEREYYAKVGEKLKEFFEEKVATASQLTETVGDDAILEEDVATLSQRSGQTMFSKANLNQEIFVSNAARAVEAIKQDKATPKQWLAMIQKQGGLKAGEDKWLGLSDWLNSSYAKTLTKDDILDFIGENMIQIEEEHYAEDSEEFERLKDEYENILRNEGFDAAQDEMINRFGDDFEIAFYVIGGELTIADDDAAATLLGSNNIINQTRLEYTTEGLKNNREIALTVPTIESWNEHDDIHFGGAGGGRAIAWIRFGETLAYDVIDDVQVVDDFHAPYDNGRGLNIYRPIGISARDYVVHGKGRNGEMIYVVYINEKELPVAHATLEDARIAMNEYYKEHPRKLRKPRKVLVIDEIQSKRHQEGREKGYRGPFKVDEQREKELRDELSAVRKRKKDIVPDEIRGISERTTYAKSLPEDLKAELKSLREREQQIVIEITNLTRIPTTIPDAPFDKNWHELAMKRMLRLAAEEGFDKVAWTTGSQQAKRYDLGKQVDEINVYDTYNGTHQVQGTKDGIQVFSEQTQDGEAGLAEVLGKEMARKAYSNLHEGKDEYLVNGGYVSLKGDNLIGGEGMKGFYDKILPSFMSKYGKKWGVKVGEVALPNLEDSAQKMWSVDVTPEMKASVMEGQTMFSFAKTPEEFDAIRDEAHREKGIVIPNLGNTSIEIVDVKPHDFKGNLEEAREQAKKWAEDNLVYEESGKETRKYSMPNNGGTYEISKKAVKKYVDFSAINKSENAFVHLSALKKLPEIISNSVEAEIHADYDKGENGVRVWSDKIGNKDLLVHRLYGAINLGDNVYRVKTTMYEYRDTLTKNTPHSYEVTKIELIEDSSVTPNDGIDRPLNRSTNSISGAKLLENVEKSYDPGVKLLDASEKTREGDGQDVTQFSSRPIIGDKKLFEGLRELGEGEMSAVERVFTESKSFEFTSKNKIESYDDVAYIFKQLENESVENTFVVLVKKGKPTVVHLAMGHFTQSFVNRSAIHAAVTRVQPDKIYFVHNHPSGVLKSSPQDRAILTQLYRTYGEKVQDGIIINTYSGEYGVFDIMYDDSRRMPQQIEGERPIKVYSFSKQVYNNDFRPTSKMDTAEAIAGFITSHRLGDREKLGLIVLNNGLGIVGNVFLPYTEVTSDNVKSVGKDIAYHAVVMGGTRAILYGNGALESIADKGLSEAVRESTEGEIQLLDYLHIEGGNAMSASSEGVRFSVAQNASPTERLRSALAPMGIEVRETDVLAYAKWSSEENCLLVNPDVSHDYDTLVGYAVTDIAKNKGFAVALGGTEKAEAFIDDVIADVFADLEGDADFAAAVRDAGYDVREAVKIYLSHIRDYVPEFEESGIGMYLSNRLSAALSETYGDVQIFARFADMILGSLSGRYDQGVVDVMQRVAARWEEEHRSPQSSGGDGSAPPTDEGKITKSKAQRALRESREQRSARVIYEENVKILGAEFYLHGLTKAIWNALKSKSGEKLAALKDNLKRLGNEWVEVAQDRTNAVRQLQLAIEKAGGEVLQSFEDVWRTLGALSSKNYAEMQEVQRKLVKPLAEVYASIKKRHGYTHDEIEKYLYCKHALERNVVMGQRKYEEELERGYERVKQLHAEDAQNLTKRKFKARYAEELAKVEEKAKKALTKDYSGLKELLKNEVTSNRYTALVAAAQKVVADFESKVGNNDVSNLWNKMKALSDFALKKEFDSGLISRELYNDVREMYQNYVPLRGWENDAAGNFYHYNTDIDVFEGMQRAFKRAYGRTSQAKDIMGHMIAMANTAITCGNKNMAKQKFLFLAENHPNDVMLVSDVWYHRTPDGRISAVTPNIHPSMTPEEVAETLADFEAQMKAEAAAGNAKRYKNDFGKEIGLHMTTFQEKQHGVRVMINGKEKMVWIVGDPRAAMVLNGSLSNKDEIGIIRNFFNKLMRFQNASNTSMNLNFLLGNVQRDFQTSLNSAFINKGAKYAAKFSKNYGKVMAKGAFPIVGLMRRYNNGTLDMSNEMDKAFYDFAMNGGITGITSMLTAEEAQDTFESQVDDINGGLVRGTKNVVKGVFNNIELTNNAFENATRFATFLTSREMGSSMTEAVMDAKEHSVNFNMRGTGSWFDVKYLFNCIAFANASLQALRLNLEWWGHSKSKTAASFLGYVAMGIANAVIMSLLFGDDDDDDKVNDEWYGLSRFNRYNNFNVLVGDGSVKVSIPHEFRAPFAIGNMIVDAYNGKISQRDAIAEILAMPGNYSPVGVIGPGTDITDVNDVIFTFIGELVPTPVAKDIYDLVRNENYLGSPIHNIRDYNKDLPEFQRAGKRTFPIFVEFSKFMNDLAGGAYNRRSAGENYANNPSVLQYLLEQRVGGGLMMWVNAGRAVYDAVDPESEVDVHDIPFAKAVWAKGGKDNVFQTMVWNDFKVMNDAFNLVDMELKRNAKKKEVSLDYRLERLAEMEQNGELAEYFTFYPYAKKDEEYQKLIKAAQKDGDDDEVKRLRQEQLEFRTYALGHMKDATSTDVELQTKVERTRATVQPYIEQMRKLESAWNIAYEKDDAEKKNALESEIEVLESDTTMLRNAELFKDYESAQRDWIKAKNNGDTEEAEELWEYMMNIARMLD